MKTGIGFDRYSAGYGYIILPAGLGKGDRDKFITKCFNTGTVCILTENNDVIFDIAIDKEKIKQITFPQLGVDSYSSSTDPSQPEKDVLGSLIVWINIPVENSPIVIAILSKNSEVFNGREGQFVIDKFWKNNSINIVGDAKNGKLYINVLCGDDDLGEMIIDVNSKNNTGKLTLNASGEINLNTRGTLNLKPAAGGHYLDELNNEIIIGDKFFISSKGYSLFNLFNEIIEEIARSKVLTSLGVQPLLNSVQITQLKNKVNKILK